MSITPSEQGAGRSCQALALGTRLGEFEIVGFLGEGGFSIVYLARDHSLRRDVAIKEYLPGTLAGRRGDNTVTVRSAHHRHTFEAGLRSFVNEAHLLAQFDHPALVRVYRFWEANGTAYMAMPYYLGRTLKQLLTDEPGAFDETRLKALLVPILGALELLHRHHCYHRDVSPDNIMVQIDGAPVLLDFGAARRSIADNAQAFTVILKPGYAPVEQYADDGALEQGPWTDIYAVAAVLYMVVAGKPPPTSVTRMITDPLEPLAQRTIPGFGAAFLAGIDRGLGVRPEHRPQTIDELRRLLGIDAAAMPPSAEAAREVARVATMTPAEQAATSGRAHVDDEKTIAMPQGHSASLGMGVAVAIESPKRRKVVAAAAGAVVIVIVLVVARDHLSEGNREFPPAAQKATAATGSAPGAPPTETLTKATEIDRPPDRESAVATPSDTLAPHDPTSTRPPAVDAAEPVATPPAKSGQVARTSPEESAGGLAAKGRDAREPTKEQCRDWKIRISIGEPLTPQERIQFDTRCQL